MEKFVKKGAFMLLVAFLAVGMANCKDDDPDYENVTPPEVPVTNSISGVITGVSGEGINGATVTMDGTTTLKTAADGTYAFENVKTGSHTLKAEANGKIAKEESVSVENSEKGSIVLWNATLANEGITITTNEDGVGEAKVETETVKGNEKAKIEITVTVPENAVSDKTATITITPIYSINDAAKSRSTRASEESVLLVGTNLKCSNASATLATPMTLTYNVDAEITGSVSAKKLVNGLWVNAPFEVNEGTISVTADSFTSYSLFLNASITTKTSSEVLTFNPNTFDNLYGSGDMAVGTSSYQYKVGTEITSSGTTKLTAYLIEILARLAGASVTTIEKNYPINVTLSVGTALSISGTQSATTYTVSALKRSVSGKKYGNISVTTRAYNRQHTGGSN